MEGTYGQKGRFMVSNLDNIHGRVEGDDARVMVKGTWNLLAPHPCDLQLMQVVSDCLMGGPDIFSFLMLSLTPTFVRLIQ